MHVIVCWKIGETSRKKTEIDDAIKQELSRYSWIQPLPNFYILEIFSRLDWMIIQEKLLSIAHSYSNEMNFIMSPVYYEETDYFVYRIPDNNFCNPS